jgi:hypothetical protein
VFTIADADRSGLSEQETIEHLIAAVANLDGAVFIRNEEQHTPAEAADHMRRKWRSQADRIHTAEDFIDLAATGSSVSGKPYVIRFPDGAQVESAQWLRQQLAEIVADQPPR